MGASKNLIKIYASGSVDNGKSTIIGRLLYDSHALYKDQIDAISNISSKKGFNGLDFSLFTDGLEDERSQGITIDVAYRYFSTPNTKFIIADTPGHFQYTKNMVSGSSDTDIAMVLIDIKKGVNAQVIRHGFISGLFKVPRIVFCVNKMDLCDYEEKSFTKIKREIISSLDLAGFNEFKFIPISALHGENVVGRSENMHWYKGPTVLEFIESINHYYLDELVTKTRFSVQALIKKKLEGGWERGLVGQLYTGEINAGDEIKILPSGISNKIKTIFKKGLEVEIIKHNETAILILDEDISISRGDLLIKTEDRLKEKAFVNAQICCFQNIELCLANNYIFRIHSAEYFCKIEQVYFKYSDNFRHKQMDVSQLNMNDIASVLIRFAQPIYADAFSENRSMGRFILIDLNSFSTIASGIID